MSETLANATKMKFFEKFRNFLGQIQVINATVFF